MHRLSQIFVASIFLPLLLFSQQIAAQRASILDPDDLGLEIPVIQVGDNYYSLELNYEGGIAFSVDAANLLSDARGTAGTFDSETLELRLPLVAFGDVRYDIILQYDGMIFNVIAADEIVAPTPLIIGTAFPPDIYTTYTNNLPSGGVSSVCLFTMELDVVGDCISPQNLASTLDFEFTGVTDQAYIVSAFLGNGGGFSMLTEPLLGDYYQDLDISAEIEFNLMYTTAFAMGKATTSSYFSGHEDEIKAWKSDAQIAIDRYRTYQTDRDPVHQADRLTEAIFNLTVDKLNQGTGVDISLLEDEDTLNAYGAVNSFNRDISSLVNNPITPLNPGFIFAANKNLAGGGTEKNVGFSNMGGEQWDFLSTGTSPHLNVGGEVLVFSDTDLSVLGTADFYLNRIYKQELGSSTKTPISPLGLDCITPKVSPDGEFVAYACIEVDNTVSGAPYLHGAYDIYIAQLQTGILLTRVSEIGDHNLISPVDLEVLLYGATGPAWSSDGQSLYFSVVDVDRTNPANLDLTGSIHRHDVLSGQNQELWGLRRTWIAPTLSITPDSETLFFSMIFFDGDSDGDTSFNIFTMDLETAQVFYFTQTPENGEAFPSISFDGRFLFYVDVASNGETVKLSNRYQFSIEKDFGDFANASNYFAPVMVATEFGLVAAEGTQTDEFGSVISSNDNRTNDNYSGYNDHNRVYNETRNTVLQLNPSNYTYYTPIAW